jgi:hypothetical protein
MMGVWHMWTENFRDMDFPKKEVWTGIGPLNHASTQHPALNQHPNVLHISLYISIYQFGECPPP